ncbi:uncharacterized protein LOC133192931 [Saccostrea echinata]|uniref:uncharacterized protein LOC133192931 n=1 Tax=Saccostrea echinata TaxID=191078 RepID=UPI002A82B0BF|nr:uncharacterized protein LOC133192931 [Saccostrea echinata]
MEPKYKKSKEYFGNLDFDSDWIDNARSEFKDGTEYLEWLDQQLPYLERFESSDAVHYYYFRSWSRQRYFPDMEPLLEKEFEEDEDVSLTDDYVDGTVKKTEKVRENGTKPEFKDGRQLVEWLERKLPYLEPFAPEDALHYYFNRQWSRQKFELKLDILVEEDMENKKETAAQCNQGDGVGFEDKDDRNPYIKLMASPLVLEGFNFRKSEPHGNGAKRNTTREKDTFMMQFSTGGDSLFGDKMLSSIKIAKIQSRLHPLLQKNKKGKRDNFTDEKKGKKKRTNKTFSFILRVFG